MFCLFVAWLSLKVEGGDSSRAGPVAQFQFPPSFLPGKSLYIYILRFFAIIGYYKVLSMIPCAIQ